MSSGYPRCFITKINIYQDPATNLVAIAVKKAKEVDELAKYFDKEANNLERLRGYVSPHLIKPIAAYQIKEDRCLIFPWADGGNLFDYWNNCKNMTGKTDDAKWIIKQFLGIASALKELHSRNCRHGDLKPENILWFKDSNNRGTLQIADLGLAAFHETELHTRVRKDQNIVTNTPTGTSRYEPPEVDRDRSSGDPRSRQYDIWSLGCILLEMLIWLTYGYDVVVSFRKSSCFWIQDREGIYRIDPYMLLCMDTMDEHLKGCQAYRDLLKLVQTRLLIVEVSKEYGSFPDHRETAEVLHQKLEIINEKCNSKGKDAYLCPLQNLRRDFPQPGMVRKMGGNLAPPQTVKPIIKPSLPGIHNPFPEGSYSIPITVQSPASKPSSGALDAATFTVPDPHEV